LLAEIYYSDTVFINGLPVSSLFYYTTLLCLHRCLPTRIFLHFLFFYVLCSMRHVYSMRYASPLHFHTYARLPSTCMNNYPKIPLTSLFCIFLSRQDLCQSIQPTLLTISALSSLCSSSLHFFSLFMLCYSLHIVQLVLQRNNNLPLSQHLSFIHALIIRYTPNLQHSSRESKKRSGIMIPMLRNNDSTAQEQ
jgi:hypothetical protein